MSHQLDRHRGSFRFVMQALISREEFLCKFAIFREGACERITRNLTLFDELGECSGPVGDGDLVEGELLFCIFNLVSEDELSETALGDLRRAAIPHSSFII